MVEFARLETPVEDPVYTVTYDNTNISDDISGLVTRLTYTDHEHGQSDELEIEVEDRDSRWKNAWYPDVAAWLTARIGYADGRTLDCGAFELDEIEFNAIPDTVRIKALATVITPKLRTPRSFGYDGKTLKEIVEAVAARNGLTVRGEIEPIALDRVTQNHEKDLPFLVRMAEDFGYAFSVRGKSLDFHKIADLEAAGSILRFDRRELKTVMLMEKSEKTYPESQVSYHDPDLKELVRDSDKRSNIKTGDVQSMLKRSKVRGIARHKAAAHLHRVDKKQLTGSITVVGNTSLVAGANIDLSGLFKLDGAYHVTTSTHRLNRSGGYEADAEIHRVG